MRKIHTRQIVKTVAELCIAANTDLRSDVQKALVAALGRERSGRPRRILQALLANAQCARSFKLAICQDTGLAQVFVELGQKVQLVGGDLVRAINRGIEQGYQQARLRNSIIIHPLIRRTRPKFSPGVVHVDIVGGNHLKLTVLPKGFGCENKTALKMFNPTAPIKQIRDFVLATIKQAGPDACPPFVVGIGIGGGADQAAFLAKKSLLRPIGRKNPDRLLAGLEGELLQKINQTRIGPLGLGGNTTALGVNILTHPTHIAGLPVAVNISCHALRSASRRL